MSKRLIYGLCFLLVAMLLLLSVYLQFFQGIIPCALCTLQRIAFAIIGILFLLGFLVHKQFLGRVIIDFFAICFSFIGALLAARQIYMQHFPMANSSECAASLKYMVETFPINQVLQKILFEGSVECSVRGFEFLHLNMAEWSLVWFMIFFLIASGLFFEECANNRH